MDDEMKNRLQELARGPRRALNMQELKRNASRRAARDRVFAGGTAVAVGLGGYATWSSTRGDARGEDAIAEYGDCNFLGMDLRVHFQHDGTAAGALEEMRNVKGVESVKLRPAGAANVPAARPSDRPSGSEPLSSVSIRVAENVDARKLTKELALVPGATDVWPDRPSQKSLEEDACASGIQDATPREKVLMQVTRTGGYDGVDETLTLTREPAAVLFDRKDGIRSRIPIPDQLFDPLLTSLAEVDWERADATFMINGGLVADAYRYTLEYDGHTYQGWGITPEERQVRGLLETVDQLIELARHKALAATCDPKDADLRLYLDRRQSARVREFIIQWVTEVPGVEDVGFFSPAQALEDFKEAYPGREDLWGNLRADSLPGSLVVRLAEGTDPREVSRGLPKALDIDQVGYAIGPEADTPEGCGRPPKPNGDQDVPTEFRDQREVGASSYKRQVTEAEANLVTIASGTEKGKDWLLRAAPDDERVWVDWSFPERRDITPASVRTTMNVLAADYVHDDVAAYYGIISQEVAEIEITSGGSTYEARIYEPPPEWSLGVRFFVGFTAGTEPGSPGETISIVARNARGETVAQSGY